MHMCMCDAHVHMDCRGKARVSTQAERTCTCICTCASQVHRQRAHVNAAIAVARRDGLTHLLFLDDDELLYCPHGVGRLHAELAAAPADRPDVHLRNLEALMPGRASASPFREAHVFWHMPAQCALLPRPHACMRMCMCTMHTCTIYM